MNPLGGLFLGLGIALIILRLLVLVHRIHPFMINKHWQWGHPDDWSDEEWEAYNTRRRFFGSRQVWRDNSTGTTYFYVFWIRVWRKGFTHSTGVFE